MAFYFIIWNYFYSIYFLFRCKFRCLDGLREDEKIELLTKFNQLESNNKQDIYLQGLMECDVCQKLTAKKQEPKTCGMV